LTPFLAQKGGGDLVSRGRGSSSSLPTDRALGILGGLGKVGNWNPTAVDHPDDEVASAAVMPGRLNGLASETLWWEWSVRILYQSRGRAWCMW